MKDVGFAFTGSESILLKQFVRSVHREMQGLTCFKDLFTLPSKLCCKFIPVTNLFACSKDEPESKENTRKILCP